MATPKKTPETDLDALAADAATADEAKAAADAATADEAKAAADADNSFVNESSNPRQVGARVVPVGGVITLTQLERDDRKVRAQVTRMLELKILKHVSS